MNEEDRRVLRTRRLLKEALLTLVLHKEYEKITIRDVTDSADIGYATFFRHYDGIDELMLEIFTGIIEELEALPERHAPDYFEQEGRLLFQHIQDHSSLYRAVLGSHTFTRKLRSHVGEMMLEHLKSHGDVIASPAIPPETAAVHMVSSLLGLTDWWLETDMRLSIDDMAAIYERLIIRATWKALVSGDPLPLPWKNRKTTDQKHTTHQGTA